MLLAVVDRAAAADAATAVVVSQQKQQRRLTSKGRCNILGAAVVDDQYYHQDRVRSGTDRTSHDIKLVHSNVL